MEHMELDEIDRQISKRTWDRFQTEMEKLEYRRRNSDLEHRIKMLQLQLNMPKVIISKNIPRHSTIDHGQFESQMRDALQLNALKRERILTIERDYNNMAQKIQTSSSEIIGMFENLQTVKKKRYYESQISSAQQEIAHLDSCIELSKKQLNEKRYTQEQVTRNFIIQAAEHWKSIMNLHEKKQNVYTRLKKVCEEIETTRNNVAIMEHRAADIQKAYEQLKMEKELIHSQTPRVIPKLPITYNSLERDSGIIDSPASDSPPSLITEPKRIKIIENILIKPADPVATQLHPTKTCDNLTEIDGNKQESQDKSSPPIFIRPQPVSELDVKPVEDKFQYQENIAPTPMDSQNIEIVEKKPQEIKNGRKSKKSTKRNSTTEVKCVSTVETRKKSRITVDSEMHPEKTVEFNIIPGDSPRKLRSRKILTSDIKPVATSQKKSQQNKTNEIDQLSHNLKKLSPIHDLESYQPSKCSSPAISCANISMLSNLPPNQSNFDSFLLNTSGQGSQHTSSDSKNDDFFIVNNEGDGFDFFQRNDDDQLFPM